MELLWISYAQNDFLLFYLFRGLSFCFVLTFFGGRRRLALTTVYCHVLLSQGNENPENKPNHAHSFLLFSFLKTGSHHVTLVGL